MIYRFIRLVRPLQGGLHDFCGAWRRCNSLEWNDPSALLRLALHPNWGKQVFRRQAKTSKNRTLHPVQLKFPGSSDCYWVLSSFSEQAYCSKFILDMKASFIKLGVLETRVPPLLWRAWRMKKISKQAWRRAIIRQFEF
jgi:hypothetical protein